MNEENFYKKIQFCLKLLTESGYDLNRLNRFKFHKISVDMFGIVSLNILINIF